jgi:hypothetical protein
MLIGTNLDTFDIGKVPVIYSLMIIHIWLFQITARGQEGDVGDSALQINLYSYLIHFQLTTCTMITNIT